MRHILHTIIQHKWILLLVLLFVVVNSIFISQQWYFMLLLPFGVLVGYLAIFSLEKLLLLLVFCVPLSYPLEKIFPGLGFNLQLPSEIMILVVMVVFLLKILKENDLDKRIMLHPVSIVIYLYLAWMFLTVVTSTMPLVSIKYFISRAWFICVFYFLALQLFRTKRGIRLYFWAYFISFVMVMLMAIYKMLVQGYFDQYVAKYSASPFFEEHTCYGACIAMVLPFILCFSFYPKYTLSRRVIYFISFLVVMLALVFSYTRAAWISVGVACFVWVVLLFRIKFVFVLLIFSILLGGLYINRQQITLSMEQNHQDSSKELNKHLKSIYNIRSDVSNLERINRWKCAIKMFWEKPVFGYGPGTYMFNYAPFQVSHDRTVISTNRGDVGNAHSEYLGVLAESGIIGLISFILLLIVVFYTAINLYSTLDHNRGTRLLLLGATLGLVTFYAHGILNDYLESDKASALFWGYIAMIVAIDVYHNPKSEVILQN